MVPERWLVCCMVVRKIPELSFSHTNRYPSPTLKEGDRLEFSFPNVSVALLKGKTLKINETAIPLRKNRLRIMVDTNGLVTASNAPVRAASWDSIDYIQQVSSQLGSNQAAISR